MSLGTQVQWNNAEFEQQCGGGTTITAALRPTRMNEARLAESRMYDSTPVGLRLRRALTVLNANRIRQLQQLTFPNGKWKGFNELSLPAWEKRWSAQDYQAICKVLEESLLEQKRRWAESEGGVGQQALQFKRAGGESQAPNSNIVRRVQQAAIAEGGGTPRVVSDKFRCL